MSGVESLSESWTWEALYALAAGAEVRSEHPLGKAVVTCYRESTGQTPPACQDFLMLPGRGVQAQVDGTPCWRATGHCWRRQGWPCPGGLRQKDGWRRAAPSFISVWMGRRWDSWPCPTHPGPMRLRWFRHSKAREPSRYSSPETTPPPPRPWRESWAFPASRPTACPRTS